MIADNSKDLVSVIVPAFNIENYIERCVQSILNQDYTNLEILVVNDGSTDGTVDTLMKIQDKRLKVLSKPNGGLSSARNCGIDHAAGKYILSVDGDDYICKSMVSQLHHSIVHNHTSMAVCDYQKVDEGGNNIPTQANFFSGKVTAEQFWGLLYEKADPVWGCVAWNKLYDRVIFEGLRYDEGKYHEDEFILHKILDRVDSISIVNKKLYCYRIRDNSIMNSEYSIKRLDCIEALLYRTDYLAARKYNAALKHCMNRISALLCEAIYSGSDTKKFKTKLKWLQTEYAIRLNTLLADGLSIPSGCKNFISN